MENIPIILFQPVVANLILSSTDPGIMEETQRCACLWGLTERERPTSSWVPVHHLDMRRCEERAPPPPPPPASASCWADVPVATTATFCGHQASLAPASTEDQHLSVSSWDCWLIQLHGLSSHQVVTSLLSTRQSLLDYPVHTESTNLVNLSLKYTCIL